MAKEKEILGEQAFASDRISTQVRTVALSMIAVAWLFLSGGANLSTLPSVKPSAILLFACILCSLIALVFDYIQYVAAYINSKRTHDNGPCADGEYKYDYNSLAYRVRKSMFWVKQVALWLAIACFVLAMLGALK